MDALSLAMPVLALGQTDTSTISPTDSNLVVFPPDHPALQPKVTPQDLSPGAQTAAVAGMSAIAMATIVISLASTALSAYHGYKRNGGSLGWGIWWGLMGSAFGPIPVGIAYAQGFGKRAR
jgi:hypothetical protein